MSETLDTAAREVRYLLKDLTPSNPDGLLDTDIYRALVRNAQRLASDVGQGEEWVTSIVTLTVGSLADYTLTESTTQEYMGITLMRIADTGRTIPRVSLPEIDSLRQGLISTSSQGDPYCFALWEDSSQAVKMRINSVPSVARTLDAMRSSVMPAAYTSTTTLPFVADFLQVVHKAAACELAASTPEDVLAKNAFDRGVLPKWEAEIKVGVLREKQRKHRIKRSGYGVGVGCR